MSNNVVIITGPTASGKTSLGCKLADFFNGEIISADSRQVYRRLDIGTGKDLSEYIVNGKNIPFHLIDIVEPTGEYNLKQFFDDANRKIREIDCRGKFPFIVGGTPLYIDSLISDYKFPLPQPDQELRKDLKEYSSKQLIDLIEQKCLEIGREFDSSLDNSRPRLIRILEDLNGNKKKNEISESYKCNYLILGVLWDRSEIHNRIERRLDDRLKSGMVEEVENLNKVFNVSWEKLDSFGLEYRYISQYLRGKTSFNEMRNTLVARIRQFARSQDIWFRKIEKKGHDIYWIKEGNIEESISLIRRFIAKDSLPAPSIRISEIYYGKKT